MDLTKKENLLVPRDEYLSAGVHIGMTFKTADMKKFIYKVRPNGLAVLNVGMLNQRILYAANMLARAQKILIVSKKDNGQKPAEKLAEAIGAKAIVGRFMPGSLTNPSSDDFFEPSILLATDPLADRQAVNEAIKIRIPIIAVADTFNLTSYTDLIIPANNKGKQSVALVYWIIAREVCKIRGTEFTMKLEDFAAE